MDVLRLMAVLIDRPWLALALAAFFGLLSAVAKSRLAFVSGALWLAYSVYEYGMKYRLLCTGDCNIRVDLLAIYPTLLLASFAGIAGAAVSLLGRRRA